MSICIHTFFFFGLLIWNGFIFNFYILSVYFSCLGIGSGPCIYILGALIILFHSVLPPVFYERWDFPHYIRGSFLHELNRCIIHLPYILKYTL